MKDCFIKKLKLSSTNVNLPLYKEVVLKDYIKTTADNQYIALPYQYSLDDIKVDIVLKKYGNGYIFSSYNNDYIEITNGYYVKSSINDNKILFNDLVSDNTDIEVGYNTSNGNMYLNQTSETVTARTATTEVSFIQVFKKRSTDISDTAGNIAIKSLTITIGSEVHTLVPALVNNVAVLYDNATGETFGANTGNLAVE